MLTIAEPPEPDLRCSMELSVAAIGHSARQQAEQPEPDPCLLMEMGEHRRRNGTVLASRLSHQSSMMKSIIAVIGHSAC